MDFRYPPVPMAAASGEMSEQVTDETGLSATALLESILFVASEAVAISDLAATLEMSTAETERQLVMLAAEYDNRGIQLQFSDKRVQMTSAPQAGRTIERFLSLEADSRLSQAALEVLAIVAYQQPVTRPAIDRLRGVNSDAALRTLLGKGLIEETGRLETPGRPILYSTTPVFLQQFGLSATVALPLLADEEE